MLQTTLLLNGGFAAALTASNFTVVELVYAVSVAYVPLANTFGLPLSVLLFSFSLASLLSPPASSNSRCSDAKIGISPKTFLISYIPAWMLATPSRYSPRIHSTPRKTFPDLISPSVCSNFSLIACRKRGNFSTTALRKEAMSQSARPSNFEKKGGRTEGMRQHRELMGYLRNP
jgi:hypothetical protein